MRRRQGPVRHERALREWQGSGHHRSFTSPLFQAEHAHGGSPWCESCHAPRGVERAGDGVDCVSCHVRGGFIVSAHVSGDAPHPIHYDESWTP